MMVSAKHPILKQFMLHHINNGLRAQYLHIAVSPYSTEADDFVRMHMVQIDKPYKQFSQSTHCFCMAN